MVAAKSDMIAPGPDAARPSAPPAGARGKTSRLLGRLSTLRAPAAFAMSGAAFAMGSLLLARVLPTEEFGRFSLAIALFNVFAVVAPLGVDQLMLRHAMPASRRLLLILLLASLGVGVLLGLGALVQGALPGADAAMLALATSAGGIVFAAIAGLRAAAREMQALLVMTGASWVLLAVGVLAQFTPMQSALPPLALYAGGEVAIAAAGWLLLLRARPAPAVSAPAIPWREAIPLLGVAAIGTVMLQLERLLVPVTLGLEFLALFSVLASVAIFPFRLVTAGAGFSLVPRLRATSSPAARRLLVRDELIPLTLLLAGATSCVFFLAPVATTLVTAGRYEIGASLLLAACANGTAKVLQVIPRAILTGCGQARDLSILNWLGWLGLAASLVGAFAGAGWGLEGVVWGVTIGSLAGTIPAAILAHRRLGA
jgi:O-antigen/teichoic acid export membrane protein